MTSRGLFSLVLWSFLYVLMQAFIFRGMILFDYGFAFVYVACVLLQPLDTPRVQLLWLAFIVGITTDFFYDTLGLHAACTVLLAYTRPWVLRLLTPARGYDQGINPASLGLRWLATYLLLATFLHHLLVFGMEAATLSLAWVVLLKALLSMLYTTAVILLIQYLRKPETSR